MESAITPSSFDPKWEKKSDTVWIVELEEDPETGELFMPIPMEAIKAQGWEIGDTLTWDYLPNGDLMLKKKTSE